MKRNTTNGNEKAEDATASPSGIVVISKAELDMKKGELFLEADELETLIEHREVFKKFITKSIHKLQAELGMCQHQGHENDVYVSINAYRLLQIAIDNTLKNYTEYNKDK